MKYHFDTVINRRNTNSVKWDTIKEVTGDDTVLPLWVADMDFEVPPPVHEAIKQRAEHGIFGYSIIPDSCYEAIIHWVKKRHGWDIKKEWILFTPGVIAGLHWGIMACTQPGDSVIIQPPVYQHFAKAVTDISCVLVENQVRYENGRYAMDFEDLASKFTKRTKLLILCSPHNPVGCVWTRDELEKLAELCLRHRITICSDDIHSDLIMPGHKHLPIASLSEEIAQQTITYIAASKTFNLAGLKTSMAIIPNQGLREKFSQVIQRVGVGSCNLFGMIATEAAYRYGEEWLEQALDYLHGNLNFLTKYLAENIPQITVIPLEGTYLAWLDCRQLGMDDAALKDFMFKKARVWLSDGPIYGAGGSGFQRINLACPRATLEDALCRIKNAVNSI